jgi:prefoldin beta subunit
MTDEEFQQGVTQLQNIQRQLQLYGSQRQRMEIEVVQMDSALTELNKASGKVYKSIGTVLIEDKPASLRGDLVKRREDYNLKIETLKKQEKRLQDKGEELQKKLQKQMEKRPAAS